MSNDIEKKDGQEVKPTYTIRGRDEDITENEAFMGKYDPIFYSSYKNATWDVVLREMWAIQRVLEGGYRIDDKRELKDKVRLLDLISDRIAKEYKRQGIEIPLMPEQVEKPAERLSLFGNPDIAKMVERMLSLNPDHTMGKPRESTAELLKKLQEKKPPVDKK